jgi:UPF0042 nucleotide-binding protein
MEFVIVTGLSGAGKSCAVNALEDIGFYCIDNMPPKLISSVAMLLPSSNEQRVAIVTDARAGELFDGFFEGLDELKSKGYDYKILFLDANDATLLKRFKESRRRHTLLKSSEDSIADAIKRERVLLSAARERADFIIDTSVLSTSQLKEKISSLFSDSQNGSLLIECMSFGFKFGLPLEADLLFDVRFLKNPYYNDCLKPLTGLDTSVRNFVFSAPQTGEFLQKIKELFDFLIPLYVREGKSRLVIAVGCTGGKHRSVVLAQALHDYLAQTGNSVSVIHRDIGREDR